VTSVTRSHSHQKSVSDTTVGTGVATAARTVAAVDPHR
jgi:hypothetical protein